MRGVRLWTWCSALAGALIALALAWAEEWTRARIFALPDSAFAVVEIGQGGRKARHLPHHDPTGAVDPAHLAAAGARLGQVRWLDPASEEVARRHPGERWQELGEAKRAR